MENKNISYHIEYAHYICQKNGPDKNEYKNHLEWYNSLNTEIKSGKYNTKEIDSIREIFGEAYSTKKTLQGHVFVKPFGYSGDFEIIDKIYNNHVNLNVKFKKWDLFFQEQSAPKAVRNRKEYFKKFLSKRFNATNNLYVLNLACGPCRDVKELVNTCEKKSHEIHCIDYDKNALNYASKILEGCNFNVVLLNKNVLRFKPNLKYDVIWSAGLFDYLDKKTFIFLLNRLLNLLNKRGEIVIGNFHPRNPTKNYMEALGRWTLLHRTEEELKNLAFSSGVDRNYTIKFNQEEEGVNLFMRIIAKH
jgi:SAM-dependent methyltransferase